MSDPSTRRSSGLFPARCGGLSLATAALAVASWPLSAAIGFAFVYVSLLLALVAGLSGLLAVGTGIYLRAWGAVAMGLIGLGITGAGAAFLVWSLTHF